MKTQKKNVIVRKMNQTKVVLGNGFDLHCGLATSYSHYFNDNIVSYKKLAKWRAEMINSEFHKIYSNLRISNRSHFLIDETVLKQLTLWDLFFLIKTTHIKDNDLLLNNQNIRWCDIEDEMYASLKEAPGKIYYDTNALNWHNIYLTLNNLKDAHRTDDVILLCCYFLFKTNGNLPKDKEKFFDYLLKQLNEFEIRFGQYINKQYESSDNYYDECSSFIKTTFSSFKRIDSIDYFNFGKNKLFAAKKKSFYINGDFSNPIFGIDTRKILSKDSEYIFTKSSRRILGDKIKSKLAKTNFNHKNILIYGHSLCEADYDYLFSIIDEMDFLNPLNKSKFVFAFSYYPGKTKEEIDLENHKTISQFFENYAKEKSLPNPSGFLSSLSNSGKVLFFEI